MSDKQKMKRRERLKEAERLKSPFKFPNLTFWDEVKEKWDEFGALRRTELFKKTTMLLIAFGLTFGGLGLGVRHQIAVAEKALLTVSPINVEQTFALSKTQITFKEQFRNGSTFMIPFTIKSFDFISSDASTYRIVAKGIRKDLPSDFKAKFILFGQTGHGVILLENAQGVGPINLYLQTDKFTSKVANADVGNLEDSDELTIKSLEEAQAKIANSGKNKTVEIDGVEIKSSRDIVTLRVNPDGENVNTKENFNFSSSPANLYEVSVGAFEKALIDTNRAQVEKQKELLVNQLEEFERRLDIDNRLNSNDVLLIKQADKMAMSSTGTKNDKEAIDGILNKTSLKNKNKTNVSSSSDDSENQDPTSVLNTTVDTSRLTKNKSVDTLEGLAQLRSAFMTLNRKLAVFDAQLKAIHEVASGQTKDASIMEDQSRVKRLTK